MGKILLIEDEGSIKNLVKEKLRNKGHTVKHVNDCTGAIGLWRKYDGDFDCIILDLNINPHGLPKDETNLYFPVHGLLVLSEICLEKILKEKKAQITIEITKEREVTLKEKAKVEIKDGERDALVKEIRGKTIVFSAYLKQLKERKNIYAIYKDLKYIDKNEATCISDLMEAVSDLLKGKK